MGIIEEIKKATSKTEVLALLDKLNTYEQASQKTIRKAKRIAATK